MRTTRAPSCWAPHKRSQISASLGSDVWRGLLELASIRARLGAFTPTKRYSAHAVPAACGSPGAGAVSGAAAPPRSRGGAAQAAAAHACRCAHLTRRLAPRGGWGTRVSLPPAPRSRGGAGACTPCSTGRQPTLSAPAGTAAPGLRAQSRCPMPWCCAVRRGLRRSSKASISTATAAAVHSGAQCGCCGKKWSRTLVTGPRFERTRSQHICYVHNCHGGQALGPGAPPRLPSPVWPSPRPARADAQPVYNLWRRPGRPSGRGTTR